MYLPTVEYPSRAEHGQSGTPLYAVKNDVQFGQIIVKTGILILEGLAA